MRLPAIFLGLALLAPLSAQADPTADLDKLVGIMEKLGTLVESKQGDCDKLAAAVSGFADTNSATIKELVGRLEKVSPEEKKALKAKFAKRAEAAQTKVAAGAQKCADHAKTSEAFKRLLAK